MRINKKIFVGMTGLVLLFGFVLAGCATVNYTYVDSVTSQAIYEAASELVSSQEDGIAVGALITGLSQKFPGIRKVQEIADGKGTGEILVTYNNKNYNIYCEVELPEIEESGALVSIRTTNRPDPTVKKISSVKEAIKVEP
jgi:hypothetical protein